MAGHVQDIDHGWKKIKAELLKLTERRSVVVGIVGEEAEREHDGGATNAEVGTWHEFGTKHGVPERSFLRATIDANGPRYADLIAKGVGRIVDGKMDAPKLLALVGERVVGDVKNRIKAGIAPALRPATVRRKTRADGAAAATPLILTGQLLRAISYAVRDGEGGK